MNYSPLKTLARKILPPKLTGLLILLRHESALDKWGWYISVHNESSCDQNGNPIPWISYAAFSLLARKLDPKWHIFEFGAGLSTLWWAARCQSITSCEHDVEWGERIKPHLPQNASLIINPLDETYPVSICSTGQLYDVVVVDGRKRAKCALSAANCLKTSGVIIWDDTDREHYRGGLQELSELGFRQLDLIGMSPLVLEEKQTSILYRPNNCLGL
ncbi:MAG TPA: hypothetical protein VH601_01125 [Bryobacteraceae bacterium]|jgi:hypothetical protein